MKKVILTVALVFGLVAGAVGVSYTISSEPVAKACTGTGC